MGRPLHIRTKLMGKGLEVSTVFDGSKDFLIEKNGKLKAKTYLQYETLVFHRSTGGEPWDVAHYHSEEDARNGHRSIVAKWKAKTRGEVRDELALRKEAKDS